MTPWLKRSIDHKLTDIMLFSVLLGHLFPLSVYKPGFVDSYSDVKLYKDL